jgi:hypothetical protein
LFPHSRCREPQLVGQVAGLLDEVCRSNQPVVLVPSKDSGGWSTSCLRYVFVDEALQVFDDIVA